MLSRLTQYWVYGGFLAGILMLVLLPELARNWSMALVAVFLQLPIYMLHQYEEHDNDRFRLYLNRVFGEGEVLSHSAVFVINVPGVWGVNAASFYLASCVSLGYGLIAVYLTLVNSVVHFVAAVRHPLLQSGPGDGGVPLPAGRRLRTPRIATDGRGRLGSPPARPSGGRFHSCGNHCLCEDQQEQTHACEVASIAESGSLDPDGRRRTGPGDAFRYRYKFILTRGFVVRLVSEAKLKKEKRLAKESGKMNKVPKLPPSRRDAIKWRPIQPLR